MWMQVGTTTTIARSAFAVECCYVVASGLPAFGGPRFTWWLVGSCVMGAIAWAAAVWAVHADKDVRLGRIEIMGMYVLVIGTLLLLVWYGLADRMGWPIAFDAINSAYCLLFALNLTAVQMFLYRHAVKRAGSVR